MPTSALRAKVAALFKKGDKAKTADAKGIVLEEIVVFMFSKVKGVPQKLMRRNSTNHQVSQEIDVTMWNDRLDEGLEFLPNVLIAECKNWDQPVGSNEIDVFVAKLRNRGCPVGFLVAASGISGKAHELRNAHERIANALDRGISVIVLTRRELLGIGSAGELVHLLKAKLVLLGACRTSIE
ncbi:restriction endonuclease [Hyalangium minutum]|uniref:restriction endonuclease n=1 Tax=Hyalangium minutum TaxID=394096 RepID=UPI00094B59C1|nr:restriction endonuclease [Hyalangium minutum]